MIPSQHSKLSKPPHRRISLNLSNIVTSIMDNLLQGRLTDVQTNISCESCTNKGSVVRFQTTSKYIYKEFHMSQI